MREKMKKEKKNFDAYSKDKDAFQTKKVSETLSKLKYVRNKCTKYRYD